METVANSGNVTAPVAAPVPNIIYTLQYPVHVSGVSSQPGQVTVNTVNVRKVSPTSLSTSKLISKVKSFSDHELSFGIIPTPAIVTFTAVI